MAEQIPAHYHQLPKTTGTNTVYPDGLPLWDANGKRMVIGDGVTPGGIPQAKQEDDTTYNRRFVSENVTMMNRDWAIAKASCTVILPAESDSVLQSVRVSALADNVDVVSYTNMTKVLYTLQQGMTIEYVCAAGGKWEVVEANMIPDFSRYLLPEALQFNGASDTQVSFKQMTYDQYTDALAFAEPVKDAIYYITDTKQIIVNGISYGTDVMLFVESFPQIGASGKLYWNTVTGEIKCYENGKWLTSNSPVINSIDSTTSDYYVPTAKAVHDFVETKLAETVLTPLDNLIISFKANNFEAISGYFYICIVDDLRCTLPEGTEGDIMRFMTKNCTDLLITPGSGIIHDDPDREGILLDIENATVTLYRDATGWSVISY